MIRNRGTLHETNNLMRREMCRSAHCRKRATGKQATVRYYVERRGVVRGDQ
jgi:hypothetical protein